MISAVFKTDRNISALKDLISHMIINILNYIYIQYIYIYIYIFSNLADAFINEDNGSNQNQ